MNKFLAKILSKFSGFTECFPSLLNFPNSQLKICLFTQSQYAKCSSLAMDKIT